MVKIVTDPLIANLNSMSIYFSILNKSLCNGMINCHSDKFLVIANYRIFEE